MLIRWMGAASRACFISTARLQELSSGRGDPFADGRPEREHTEPALIESRTVHACATY